MDLSQLMKGYVTAGSCENQGCGSGGIRNLPSLLLDLKPVNLNLDQPPFALIVNNQLMAAAFRVCEDPV